ncbi:S8 family serine peptidase [Anabaena sp. UHCC 0451]|uniref:S8 family serine peptidase n=1 Tax=Anabaena sp. UHCC 0451 TaxID=2055235 RepID=UPI002B1FA928|nr:S8 family serine peptidase [Anabaena sp. UHCC 0451]MEA5579672.1 S8 family serine peptidase [Anabaena sp. UHCC 0451]
MNPLLNSVLSLTYNQLCDFSNSNNFWQVFNTAFSTQYNRSIAEILRLQWESSDFSQLPEIELISSDILGNANGAYAISTNKIYLLDTFVATATPAEISAVLLEEIGHFVDAQINLTDSAGDEGKIFADLIQGYSLDNATLQDLRTENDHATIAVNGENIEVEQNSPVSPRTWDLASLGLKVLTTPIQAGPGLTLIATGPDPSQLKINVPFNQNAAISTRANTLWTGGGLGLNLTGAGITVGVWDEGPVRSTHQELTGRVTVVDAGTASNHATHVGGTIGATGVVSAAQGMAEQVLIRSRDWTNDLTELNSDANLIQLSNHSYGFLTGWSGLVIVGGIPTDFWQDDRSKFSLEDPDFGLYSSQTQALDNVLYNNKALLSVWAAGNDRDDNFTGANGTKYVAYLSPPAVGTAGYYLIDPGSSGLAAPPQDGNAGAGYDSLPEVQTAKNSLVIGAISDTTWTGSNTIATGGAMLPFSSWGMTDDGRVKVDLVANGDNLYSSIATNNTAYTTYSGTSMATPNVTGTMALLYQHHKNLDALNDPEYENVPNITNTSTKPRFINIAKPSSATMKGLAIHTATDLGNVGPDYTFGWGLMNGQSAAIFLNDLKNPYTSNRSLLAEDTFVGSPKNLGKVNSSGGNVKITLIWTDPAPVTLPVRGVNNATIDNSASVLVNDLDLYLKDSLGNTYYPWTLNPGSPSSSAVKTTANHRDNIEQVVFNATTEGIGAGNYTVYVGGSLASGYTAQDFSIFFSSVPQFGNGHGWGDVHLITFDGKAYDFQAVGEFIFIESTVDDWQIQTRQEIYPAIAGTSVNTAFATNIDGYKVVFDIDNATDKKITIDGNSLTLVSGQSQILNTSKIERQGDIYTLIWAGLDGNLNTSDDDRVTAYDNGNHINIYVDPADYRTTFVQGLLGNGDGDISNEFTLRNGTLLSPNPTVQQIHTQWADSWRISQQESLFGTQTFSNPDFPKQYIGLEDLPLATVNAAKIAAFKAGLPAGHILDGAAFDFAVTGEESFIKSAAITFADVVISPKLLGNFITLDVDPITVTEDGQNRIVYTFTRTGSTTKALTVKYGVGGTATFNTDYTQIGAASFTATTGTITFAAGSSTAKVTIDPKADTIIESDETVALTLAAGKGYTIGTTTEVTGTIINDDVAPFTTISLSADQTIVEGRTSRQNLIYKVALSNTSTQPITVQYATADGTAIAGLDYISKTGTLTFKPGVKTQNIIIPILNDAINEADETFTLTLTSPINASLGNKTTATTTITDTLTASVTTTLPTNVENLTLTRTSAINGTGNAGNNVLTGNSANNTLAGLNGNDTYVFVANTPLGTDKITETATGGIDTLDFRGTTSPIKVNLNTITTQTVNSNLKLILSANNVIENATGGTANDRLTGNTLSNTLNGGDGNDRLQGLGGNDILIGEAGDDILTGGGGDDLLWGGLGDDIVTGNIGKDQYLFQGDGVFATSLGVDYISEFEVGQDQILLSKNTFNAVINNPGEIFTDFAVVADDDLVDASNARIVFSQNTGSLFYNQNGNVLGAAAVFEFAYLGNPDITLSSSNFSLVA